MGVTRPGPERDAAAVVAAARDGEPDRYLAALLAPAPRREALLALAAYAAEVARVPFLAVREPAMGEIRLQWWRDALEQPKDARTGHAVADAVRAAVATCGLPAAAVASLIDGHSEALDPAPPADEAALRDRLWKTEGLQFLLVGRILGQEGGAAAEAASAAAGHAYGLTRVLWTLPRILSLGRIPLAQPHLVAAGLTPEELLAGPDEAKARLLMANCIGQARDSLDTARRCVSALPATSRAAFLPLAVVGPYLRVLERPGRDLTRVEARLAPLVRVCRIGAAHVLGRP